MTAAARGCSNSIDKSLRWLRTDHVDIYLVDWPDPNTPLDETMEALDDIVQQGKARYVGVSNFRLGQIEEAMRLRRVDVVQYAWNMFDRRMQTEIFPYCGANRVAVMAYGSLAYGMLSGTFHSGISFNESDWRSKSGNLGNLNLFRLGLGLEFLIRAQIQVSDRDLRTQSGEALGVSPSETTRRPCDDRNLPVEFSHGLGADMVHSAVCWS